MKRWLLILLTVTPLLLHAEGDPVVPSDSVSLAPDGERVPEGQERGLWRPDPARATWMATLCPGLGQIYNKSYWKLPIVYGGLMGCVYAVTWNNGRYTSYKEAYRDLATDIQNQTVSDDRSKSYIKILPEGYTLERVGGAGTYVNSLENRQNVFRRYRDLSIALTVLVYGLSIIDAYVDAQLFNFDISPDLTLDVNPTIYHDLENRRSAELQVAIHF